MKATTVLLFVFLLTISACSLDDNFSSESADGAESALKEINAALSGEDELYLRWMQRAGTLSVIQEVLTRDQNRRPSASVAEPLLHKFAKHQLGLTTRVATQTRTDRLATYLLRRA